MPARRVPAAYKLKGVRITGGAARRWGSGQSRVKGRAAISRRQARTTAGMSIEEREREEASHGTAINRQQQHHRTRNGDHTRPFDDFPLCVSAGCTRAIITTPGAGSAADTSSTPDTTTTSSGELAACCACAHTIAIGAHMGRHIEGSPEKEDQSHEEAP